MDNVIFFISVFLAGILSFFSPCILPVLPVYAGVLLDDKDGQSIPQASGNQNQLYSYICSFFLSSNPIHYNTFQVWTLFF